MTKEEILAMEAGPELDDLVQETLFPLAPIHLRYSRDDGAAWLVWWAITKDAPEDWAIYSDSNGEVSVEHYPDEYGGSREKGCGDFHVDGLFPEAICKAALLWKMH